MKLGVEPLMNSVEGGVGVNSESSSIHFILNLSDAGNDSDNLGFSPRVLFVGISLLLRALISEQPLN